MANDNIEKDFICNWHIENFSFCTKKNGEYLTSPIFTAETLGRSKWQLILYPRGDTRKSQQYVSCYLQNVELHSKNITLDVTMGISYNDKNEKLAESGLKAEVLQEADRCGFNTFLKRDLLYKYDPSNPAIDDTLVCFCTMVSKEPKPKATSCDLFTQFGVLRRKTPPLKVKMPNSKEYSKPSEFDFPIQISLKLLKDDIMIKLIPTDKLSNVVQIISLTITLLNVDGKASKKHTMSRFLNPFSQDPWNFPKFFKKTDLSSCDNHFSLELDLITSTEKEYHRNETYNMFNLVEIQPTNLDFPSFKILNECYENMFLNQKYCDVKLKCKDTIFPGHKCILSARSPVLSAMLEDADSSCVVVDHSQTDEETFHSFLFYLYTGKLKIGNVYNAIKLLKVAAKYKVPSLINECALVLSHNITNSDVCIIFLNAEKYGVKVLKDLALNHIKSHWTAILDSPRWADLQQNNVEGASKILSEITAHTLTRKI